MGAWILAEAACNRSPDGTIRASPASMTSYKLLSGEPDLKDRGWMVWPSLLKLPILLAPVSGST